MLKAQAGRAIWRRANARAPHKQHGSLNNCVAEQGRPSGSQHGLEAGQQRDHQLLAPLGQALQGVLLRSRACRAGKVLACLRAESTPFPLSALSTNVGPALLTALTHVLHNKAGETAANPATQCMLLSMQQLPPCPPVSVASLITAAPIRPSRGSTTRDASAHSSAAE